MNLLNFALIGIISILVVTLVVVLDNNQTMSKELQSHNEQQVAELIETFKEKYSDHKITEYPNSKGIPYKYIAHAESRTVELLFAKDRVVLKSWIENEPSCIVSNPIPLDILNACPLKW